MFNSGPEVEKIFLSRTDALNPLASYSKYSFELDDAEWPSLEHYYQGMKFEDPEIREQVRNAPDPSGAARLAGQHKKKIRKDWRKLKQTYMTRGAYIRCRTHPEVARALLQTADSIIVESSQFDYFWGCGRDGRGDNVFGRILMEVRERIKSEIL